MLSLITACCSVNYAAVAGTIDSLEALIAVSKEDTVLINSYLLYGELVYYEQPDFAVSQWQKALAICEESLKKEDSPQLIRSLIIKKAHCFINIGYILKGQGNVDKALEYYLKGLDIFRETEYKKGLASAYNNIGMIYKGQGYLEKSLEYYNKALVYYIESGDSMGTGIILNNLGRIYMDKQEYSKSLEYYHNSLEIQTKIDDKQGIAYSYLNIGIVLHKQKKTDDALDYYNKSITILEEIHDKKGIAYALDVIGNLYLEQGDIRNAKETADKVLKLGRELGYPQNIEAAANSLRNIYKLQQNWEKAYEYFELEMQMRDSIINEDNRRKAFEKEARYKYLKMSIADSINHIKELEIKNTELKLKDEKNKRQQDLIYIFMGGLVIVLVFSVLVFRLLLQKRKAYTQLAFQNDEIQQKNEEITSQRDEIEAQRDRLSEQKGEITDSINYAQRIQKAVLPSSLTAKNILEKYFILFKPKDIVSGDFYWMARVNDSLIIAMADCTGHGVPGALMSMLGVSFLNEIVRRKEVTQANHVLNELRLAIIEALGQKDRSDSDILAESTSENTMQDGMDMSLCVINEVNNDLQYSGANSSLYIVSNSLEKRDGDLVEIKGDKMPIAVHRNMIGFSNHELSLKNNERIYLFTDGYADQFGGPDSHRGGRKFNYKAFKKLILETSKLSVIEQGQQIEEVLTEWMKGYEQVDDISVLGVEIN